MVIPAPREAVETAGAFTLDQQVTLDAPRRPIVVAVARQLVIDSRSFPVIRLSTAQASEAARADPRDASARTSASHSTVPARSHRKAIASM
jgi:hypothetical protein